jgi:hypothetical protein
MPLILVAMAAFCTEAVAQGAFPAPLPSQSQSSSAAAPASSSPFPPVNGAPAQRPAAASPFPAPSGPSTASSQGVFSSGAAPLGGGLGGGGGGEGLGGGGGSAAQQECMEKFQPIREDAEKKAKAIKTASERKAPAQEACGLIKTYVAAEAKLVNYVTTKQTACNIPPEVPKQLKANAARSQQMMKAVCNAAAGQAQGGGPQAAPSLSEALGSSSAPEIRSARGGSGGSTFDTINGNVLAR